MTGGVLPLWVLAPPAAVMMLVLAAYIQALREADVPESRRRIRTASSLVMMVLQPLLVYLFAIGGAHQPRPFVFTAALVLGLVALLVVLAIMDAINNTKIAAAQRAKYRSEFQKMRADIDRLRQEAREAKEAGAEPPPLRLADHTPRDGTNDA